MRILVFEPDEFGHHFAYVANILPALTNLADDVVLVTTKRAHASWQFKQMLGPYEQTFRVETEPEQSLRRGSVGMAFSRLQWLQRAIERLEPNHVYLPYGDFLVQAAGLLGLGQGFRRLHPDIEVVLLRGGYQYPVERARQRLLMAVSPWLIRRGQWSRIHILDYLDLEVLQHVGGSFAASCRLIPDPVEPPSRLSKLEARRAFDLPEDGRYIGCTGLMSSHKGIDLLVRAFREAQSKLRATDRLFLAGQMEPALRKVIESELAPEIAAQRFLLVDRPLTAQEVDDAVAALDVVCTPYPSHRHSASIVIRAAAAGKPVLGSAIGWMDHTIHRFSLGTTCNVRDTTTFARTIVETLDVAGEFHAKEAAKRFTAFHSISNFTSHFTARLRERLNLPSNALIDWDWVLESLR